MKSSIRNDSAFLIAASLQQNVFVFITQLILAHSLSRIDFGRLSFFLSILALLGILSSGGVAQYLPAITRQRQLQHRPLPLDGVLLALYLALLVGVVHMVLYFSGAYHFFRTDLGSWYVWMTLFMISTSAVNSVFAIYIGSGKTGWYFSASFIQEFIRFSYIPVALIFGTLSAHSIVVWWTLFNVGFAGIVCVVFFRWFSSQRKPLVLPPLSWKEYSSAFAFYLPSAGAFYIPRLIIFLTGCFYSAEQTAYMTVAITFCSLYGVVLQPLQTTLLSSIQLHQTSKKDMRNFCIKTALIIGAAIVVLWCAILACGYFLLVPLFGDRYLPALPLVVMVSTVFVCEWPKALLDVIWMRLLRPIHLTYMECIKIAGLLAVLTPLTAMPLHYKFGCIGIIFCLVTVVKGAVIGRYFLKGSQCPLSR